MCLHNHPNFKDLIELTARDHGIKDAYLVEKDYWIMHCLYGLSQFGLKMELKGETSLSKAYQVIHRFSEDIDTKIEPDEKRVGFEVYSGKNHDKPKHRESKKNYFDWLAENLKGKIDGLTDIVRDESFDDEKYRNGGIRLMYKTRFTPVEGLKEGVTSLPANSVIDNRAMQISCYDPRYTFVEKLQAIVTKYSFYKEGKTKGKLPENFLRHYYDLYYLLELEEVKKFIGTSEYEDYKKERFRNYDTVIKNCDGFILKDTGDREVFKSNYAKSSSLYYKGQVDFDKIMNRFSEYLDRL